MAYRVFDEASFSWTIIIIMLLLVYLPFCVVYNNIYIILYDQLVISVRVRTFSALLKNISKLSPSNQWWTLMEPTYYL